MLCYGVLPSSSPSRGADVKLVHELPRGRECLLGAHDVDGQPLRSVREKRGTAKAAGGNGGLE